MGRSFESVRMRVKDVSARWLKATRALKKEDQVYGQRLAEMANPYQKVDIYIYSASFICVDCRSSSTIVSR